METGVYTAAARVWPGVHVDETLFARYLAERPLEDDEQALRTPDLYIACACVHAVPGAFEAFERRYLTGLGGSLRGIDSSPSFVDEVRQHVRERLFTTPKLASYTGRGALEAWVAVVAQRVALTLKRRERPAAPLHEEAVAHGLTELDDPEVAFFKARYRDAFQDALRAAMEQLEPRERVLLRLSLVSGASHERIAGMYGVNQSTITRWMSRARTHIWKEVRQRLSAQLRIASGEVDSLIRVLRSDIHISMSRVLGTAE